MTSVVETALSFECNSQSLYGILHQPTTAQDCGILLVVGGPQYRVGSHRQFLLLARFLADAGYPVLRFDYQGMGDSSGPQKIFDEVDADIHAAINAFFEQQPELQRIVIWGLCDAASAALFYAHQDSRVQGLVLLNPWVFTDEGAAKTVLKHYYLNHVFSKAFWEKLISGNLDLKASLLSLGFMLKTVFQQQSKNSDSPDSTLPLPERMLAGLQKFQYPILLILSGNDLTASEFKDLVNADKNWNTELASERVQRHDFAVSDHTFSRALWRDQVNQWTLHWLQSVMLK